MDVLDTIKKFQNAGFSREQSEVQVIAMTDMKKGLATTGDIKSVRSDIESIKKDVSNLQDELRAVETRLTDRMDYKFESLNNIMETGFDSVNQRIDLMPLKMTLYFIGVIIAFLSLQSFWPVIMSWLPHIK